MEDVLPAARITERIAQKRDAIERVAQRICAILVAESYEQQQLEDAAGADPDAARIRVYLEATRPWGQWESADQNTDTTPIVNVKERSGTQNDGASNSVGTTTKWTASFSLHCYGYGVSESSSEGQRVGDSFAAEEAKRARRFARNILSSDSYVQLGFDEDFVVGRKFASLEMVEPNPEVRWLQNVRLAELVLEVEFYEHAPKTAPTTIQLTTLTTMDPVTGEVRMVQHYPAPSP